ncbi:unnamed protein product [Gordionus sp. m RMFG-2023]
MDQGNLAPVIDTYLAFTKASKIIETMKAPLRIRYQANNPVYTDASGSHIGISFWGYENMSVAFHEACLLFNIPTYAIAHINAKEVAIMALHTIRMLLSSLILQSPTILSRKADLEGASWPLF